MPESLVAVRHELAFGGKPFKRFVLPDDLRAIRDVPRDAWLQDEEATVDPPFRSLSLLGKVLHAVAVEAQRAEPRGWAYRGDRRQTAVRTMEREQGVQVDRRDCIAIREHHR